jgi:hypothetical protein
VNPIQAKLNLAYAFREKAHLRDPLLIDQHVTKGYEFLVEAEWYLYFSNSQAIYKLNLLAAMACPKQLFLNRPRLFLLGREEIY